jgi:hypothetical protein
MFLVGPSAGIAIFIWHSLLVIFDVILKIFSLVSADLIINYYILVHNFMTWDEVIGHKIDHFLSVLILLNLELLIVALGAQIRVLNLLRAIFIFINFLLFNRLSCTI